MERELSEEWCKKHKEFKAVYRRRDGSIRIICRSCKREYKRELLERTSEHGAARKPGTPKGGYRSMKNDSEIDDDVVEMRLRYLTGKSLWV